LITARTPGLVIRISCPKGSSSSRTDWVSSAA
jgi:hypothetical protein